MQTDGEINHIADAAGHQFQHIKPLSDTSLTFQEGYNLSTIIDTVNDEIILGGLSQLNRTSGPGVLKYYAVG